MNRIVIGVACLLFFQNLKAQFSLDHYHPIELIAEEGIDSCSIYVLNSDSTLTIEQSYIYDTTGMEIENRRDFQNYSFVYQYDSEGKQVTQFFIPFGEEYYERDTLIYNKKGRLVKQIIYRLNGEESTRYEYDYKRRLISEKRYILQGNLQIKSLYHYDKEKRVSKIERFYKGKHQEDWVHEYDDNGNLISFTTINANSDTTLLHRFEYNSRDLRTKHSVFSKGHQLSSMYITHYDSKGLILWMEAINGIKNNDPSTGNYEKTIYKYSYR